MKTFFLHHVATNKTLLQRLLALLMMVFSVAAFAFFYRFERVPTLAPDSAVLSERSCWFTPEAEVRSVCYTLTVIEAGQQFALPVVVLKAQPASQHALLYLSGGPGGSTFLTAEDMIYWQAQYARFNLASDLILVDRRGVGMAEPLLQCPYFRREYRKGLTKNLSVHDEGIENFRTLSWCLNQKLSAMPEANRLAVTALGTAADARDMQTLLSQLGYANWSLWGVSYGTRLALAIAQQKPQGLQSLVLDSVYPPGRGSSDEWPGLMSNAMSRFFSWCDKNHCANENSAVSEQLFQQILLQLDTSPVTLTLPSWYGEAPYTVLVNGQRYLQIVFGAIYDQYLWPNIGKSLKELSTHRSEALSVLTENFVNNAFDPDFSELVFYAAECQDNAAPDPENVDAALRSHSAYSNYMENLAVADVCSVDVFTAAARQAPLSADSLTAINVPVLMLSGEVDPITPIEWVEPLQTLLPHWQLASFAEVGHAVVSSDMCAEQLLRDFVLQPAQDLALLGENCAYSKVRLSSNKRLP